MSYLKLVPSWVWVALALVAAGLFYGHTRYEAGQDAKQAEWDKAVEKGKQEVARLRTAAGKVTVRVETKYVDRVKTIREKADAIVREVLVYVPAGSCNLPGGFRLLHDAAAEGSVPDPAGIPDAVPVPAEVVAATVATNYGACHETGQRLTSLQEWVLDQCKANPPPEGCGGQ